METQLIEQLRARQALFWAPGEQLLGPLRPSAG